RRRRPPHRHARPPQLRPRLRPRVRRRLPGRGAGDQGPADAFPPRRRGRPSPSQPVRRHPPDARRPADHGRPTLAPPQAPPPSVTTAIILVALPTLIKRL